MAIAGNWPGMHNQQDDLGSSSVALNNMDLYRNEADEAGNPYVGPIQASGLNTAAFSSSSGLLTTLTVTGATPFSSSSVGDFILTEQATNATNDGVYIIITYTSSTVVGLERVDGGSNPIDEAQGTMDWYYGLRASTQSDQNCTRTDRGEIKHGDSDQITTDRHQAPLPEYERPDAVGTKVKASLWNISGQDGKNDGVQATWPAHTYGVTLDAKAEICEIKFSDINMSEALAGDSASSTTSATSTLTAASPVFTTDTYDGRVLTLSTAGADNGDWYIYDRTDASNVVLKKVSDNSDLTTDISGTVTWVMLGDRVILPTSTEYADATDTTGIPVVDGYDSTRKGATWAFVVEAGENKGFVSSDDKPVYGHTYAASEGDTVLLRFFKGNSNTVADPHTWEADDPTSIDIQISNRMRKDEVPEDCRRVIFAGGVLSDAELVNDINELNGYTGRVDGEDATTWTNEGNYYSLQGVDHNLEAGVNANNNAIGDRDWVTYIEGLGGTDGDDLTTIINLLANEIAKQSIDRYTYAGPTVNAYGDLLLSNFTGAPASYLKSTNGTNAWLFARGNLWKVGTVANKGQYTEGPDIGGGAASKFIPNSKIDDNDTCEVFIRA